MVGTLGKLCQIKADNKKKTPDHSVAKLSDQDQIEKEYICTNKSSFFYYRKM